MNCCRAFCVELTLSSPTLPNLPRSECRLESQAEIPTLSAADAQRFLERSAAYLRHAPLALTIRELNRLLALEILSEQGGEQQSPMLDVGCGDGFWWSLPRTNRPDVYGIDISEREIGLAKQHITAEICDISKQVPFQDTKFPNIIGNCSLEHVRDIDAALGNLAEAATDDGRLILFVPSPDWAYRGATQRLLMKASPRLAMMASGMANGFFQHWHLYSPEVWSATLARNGWTLKKVFGLGNERSEFLFRLFLTPAFLGFLVKQATGTYPNQWLKDAPEALFAPLKRLLSWALSSPLVAANDESVYEYVLICERSDAKK